MSSQTAACTAGSRTSLSDRGPRGFELRLDQCDDGCTRAQELADRRQHEFQRDEAYIDRGKIRRLGKLRRIERANIGLLHRYDLAARRNARVNLAGPDIDGINAPGAACRQHLGKAAGLTDDLFKLTGQKPISMHDFVNACGRRSSSVTLPRTLP